jgi:hypothetical protein
MSSTVIDTSASTTIQSLARAIMDEFDVNQDGQFSYDEFASFLDGFMQSVSGKQSSAAGKTSTTASATNLFLTAASTATSTTTTATASTTYRDRMLGFDFSRFESAKGSLKYDAANIMQTIDPSQAGAMQKAYDELVKLHPGEVSLDKDGNLMLDGTADGYIGIRPLDRSESWTNPASGWCWQWMAYNSAHSGPNGEGK